MFCDGHWHRDEYHVIWREDLSRQEMSPELPNPFDLAGR
jgi:hypothetical protein